MTVKIGIVGSRERDTREDYKAVKNGFLRARAFCGEKDGYIAIVSGGAIKGADRFAVMLSYEFDLELIEHMPYWAHNNKGLKSSYIIRNKKIAEDVDWLVAAPAGQDSGKKGGTDYTIEFFLKNPNKNKERLIIV